MRLAINIVLALTLAAVGLAQNGPVLTADTVRRLEIRLRSLFNIPPKSEMKFGPLRTSKFPGYYSVAATVVVNGREDTMEFLLSEDKTTLVKFQEFPLAYNPEAIVDLSDRPALGDAQAKLTILVFDDLECEFCAQMHKLLTRLVARYPGQIRVIYESFPLPIHSWAKHAALDLECLGRESKSGYWALIDAIHGQDREELLRLYDVARADQYLDDLTFREADLHRVSKEPLRQCMQGPGMEIVEKAIQEGEAVGVEGTPTMFVNGERINGILSESDLDAVIKRNLAYVSLRAKFSSGDGALKKSP